MNRRPFRQTGPLLSERARELLAVAAVIAAAALIAFATRPPAPTPADDPTPVPEAR